MSRVPTLQVLAEHADRVDRALALAHDALAAMQVDITHGLTAARAAFDDLADLTTEQFSHGGDRAARAALLVYLARMGAATDDELAEYRAELAEANVTRVPLEAGECDGDCTDGEAADALEADRDELGATVERLYDGIDAALDALTSPSYGESPHAAATRILRDLRPVTE